MKTKHLKRKLDNLLKNRPFLIKIYLLIVPLLKYFHFSTERKVARGENVSSSKMQSILFFTTQKCASTMLSDVFNQLFKEKGLIEVRFSNYFKDVDRSLKFKDEAFLNKAFHSQGYYYGAFRAFHQIPKLHQYKIILVLRDPRDVLTSSYYSTAFNHPIDRSYILKQRKVALNQSIDDYVLANSENYIKIYQEYLDHLLDNENVLFLKYEDMIENFDFWLTRIAKFTNLKESEELIEQIVSKTSFNVKKEDKNNFIRNIKAGDHLKKLTPATINSLNKNFKEILISLNYSI